MEEHASKMSSVSQENKSLQFEAQVAKSEFKAFKDALAALLGEGDSEFEAREDILKDKVKNLQLANRENNVVSQKKS